MEGIGFELFSSPLLANSENQNSPLSSSIFCEKIKKNFIPNHFKRLGRQRKFWAGPCVQGMPTTYPTPVQNFENQNPTPPCVPPYICRRKNTPAGNFGEIFDKSKSRELGTKKPPPTLESEKRLSWLYQAPAAKFSYLPSRRFSVFLYRADLIFPK